MTESDDALMLRVAREEIKRQAAEIERLKARLEVSPDHPYDGIVSRDATIKLQDERIAELRGELERSERRGNLFSEVISRNCIAMQSAWIDSELVSPEQGMKWIFNTLFGPGLLPNLEAAREGGGAQAWFDRESAEVKAKNAKAKEAEK